MKIALQRRAKLLDLALTVRHVTSPCACQDHRQRIDKSTPLTGVKLS